MIETDLKANAVVENSPRLGLDDHFCFRCDKDLKCFTRCCHDVSILLTPYDVLRMKRALKMDSSDFLEKYTLVLESKEKGTPVVFLKMDENSQNCPFVGERGCAVYSQRPWSCRMYPLGMAEPKDSAQVSQRFFFVVREEICEGHAAERELSVRDWMAEQQVDAAEALDESFRRLMGHGGWENREALTPDKLAMFYMAAYDVDRFRRFIFQTKFLDFFEVDETRIEAIRTDDEELLEFAFDWIAFSILHEKRMKLKKIATQRVETQPAESAAAIK
jgi:Fe-S-cluster containining protein